MNLFLNCLLLIGFALLCAIIGCGETDDPLQPIDSNDKHFLTIAETKTPPLTGVPAAPPAPPTDGTPFVKEVSYYSDWRLTQPITGTVSPGTTFFTKIVFSEPMTFNAADDKTARPILYYQIDGERTRYRIAARGASGKNFQSGDAKLKGSGTQTFVCKYTVLAETTGTFKTAVGKRSADTDGNTLAAFYVHTEKVHLGTSPAEQTAAIHLSNNTIDENSAPNTVIGRFETPGGEDFTYQVIRGPKLLFQVNADNALIAKLPFNYESGTTAWTIVISGKAVGTGKRLTQEFTIGVNDVNEAPTGLSLSGTTFTEADGRGTRIGEISVADADKDDSHTFVLLSGSESFEIAGGTLKLLQPPPSSQAIEIEVRDSGGLVYREGFVIEMRSREVSTEDTTTSTDTDDSSDNTETSQEPDDAPPGGGPGFNFD